MKQSHSILIKPLPPILSKSCLILTTQDPLSNSYINLLNLIQKNPKKAVIEFEKLKEPLTPSLANLYCFALIKRKKERLANKKLEQNFTQFPLHFQTKINFADLCLRKKQIPKIQEIFPSFDISDLFENKPIPLNEFRGFMITMGFYHLAIKEKEKAKAYYTLAVQADPLYKGLAFLEKRLFRFEKIKKWLRTTFCKPRDQ